MRAPRIVVESLTSLHPRNYPFSVVSGEPHDGRLADCYALGATMYCVKFGNPPFVGKGREKNQRLRDLYDQIKRSPPLIPDTVDGRLRDLISRLMAKDPMERLRLADAMRHSWLGNDPM